MRLFVGAYPGRDAVPGIMSTLDGPALPPHRVTPIDQLHLTLLFIGDTQERDLLNVGESVERAASGIGPFEVSPRKVISLPHRGPSRLVAIEVTCPPLLLELHRRLAMRLAKVKARTDGAGFLPHFTLARFASPAPGVRIHEEVSLAPLRFEAIHLMRSDLRGGGPVHTAVRKVQL